MSKHYTYETMDSTEDAHRIKAGGSRVVATICAREERVDQIVNLLNMSHYAPDKRAIDAVLRELAKHDDYAARALDTLEDLRAFLKMNSETRLEVYTHDAIWWRGTVWRSGIPWVSTEHDDPIDAVRATVAKAMRFSPSAGDPMIEPLDPESPEPSRVDACVHCGHRFEDRAISDGDGRLWHPKCAAARLKLIENDARPFAEVVAPEKERP